jgi:hypothetical protein
MDTVWATVLALCGAISSQDEEVATNCVWALSYIAEHHAQMVIEGGATRRLVELLSHHNTAAAVPALRTLGKLMSHFVIEDDLQTQQAVLDCGILAVLGPLMSSPKSIATREACRLLSEITMGTADHIQAVCDAGLIRPLIDCLAMADDFRVVREAAFAVSNLTCGTAEQIGHVVELGAITALCNAINLAFVSDETRVIRVALDGLDGFLMSQPANGGENAYVDLIEQCGGLEIIEMLQQHVSPNIYERAQALILAYFVGRDEEEEEEEEEDEEDEEDEGVG